MSGGLFTCVDRISLENELEYSLGYFDEVCGKDFLCIVNKKRLSKTELEMLSESVCCLAKITSIVGRILDLNPSLALQAVYIKFGQMTLNALQALNQAVDVPEFQNIRLFHKQDQFYLEPGIKVGIDCCELFSNKSLATPLFIKQYQDENGCSLTISELIQGINLAEAYGLLEGVPGYKAKKCRDSLCESALENIIFFHRHAPPGLGGNYPSTVRINMYEKFCQYLMSLLFVLEKKSSLSILINTIDPLLSSVPFDEKSIVRYRDASPANFILETGKSKITLEEILATDICQKMYNIDAGVDYAHALLDFFMFRDSSKIIGKFNPQLVKKHVKENTKWYKWYLEKGKYLDGTNKKMREFCFFMFGFYRATKMIYERLGRIQETASHQNLLTSPIKYGIMLAREYAKNLPSPWPDIIKD